MALLMLIAGFGENDSRKNLELIYRTAIKQVCLSASK